YTSSASSADSKTADGGWPGPVRSSAPSSFEKWPGGQPRKGHGSPRRATPAREGPRQPEKGHAGPKRARPAPKGLRQPEKSQGGPEWASAAPNGRALPHEFSPIYRSWDENRARGAFLPRTVAGER